MINIPRWLLKKEFSPRIAELHVTNRCNLNCKTCWKHNKELDYSTEIPLEKWSDLISQVVRLGIKEVYLGGGGEPLVRKDVTNELMKVIKENHIRGMMTTNCTLFDEKDIKEMIRIGWDHLQVSIDGPDKKTQNFLRGEGAYENNIKILRLFNKLKKKSKKEKPHISFHTVISNKNYDKLKGIILLASKLGISEINLQPVVIQSQYCEDFLLNSKQKTALQAEFKKIYTFAKNKNILTNFEKFLKKERSEDLNNSLIKCFEPWNRITILSDGKVKTCCNPNKVYESVHKKSLEEIWYCKKFNKIRETFYQGGLMKECCTHPSKRL